MLIGLLVGLVVVMHLKVQRVRAERDQNKPYRPAYIKRKIPE